MTGRGDGSDTGDLRAAAGAERLEQPTIERTELLDGTVQYTAQVPRDVRIVRWSLATAGLWLTHLTAIYDRALTSAPLHAVEHAPYLGTATAFWAPFIRPTGRSNLGRVVAPLVVGLLAMPDTSTLALLLEAEQPRYAAYTLADQRAGAAVMWAGMVVAILGAILVTNARAMPPRPTVDLRCDPRRRGQAHGAPRERSVEPLTQHPQLLRQPRPDG